MLTSKSSLRSVILLAAMSIVWTGCAQQKMNFSDTEIKSSLKSDFEKFDESAPVTEGPDGDALPTPTPTPVVNNATPTPVTNNPTPTPVVNNSTPTPFPDLDATPTPGTQNPTPTPVNSDPTPTPVVVAPTPTPEPDDGVICHIPPGNPDNAQTLSVGQPAIEAHLRHGDTRGACPGICVFAGQDRLSRMGYKPHNGGMYLTEIELVRESVCMSEHACKDIIGNHIRGISANDRGTLVTDQSLIPAAYRNHKDTTHRDVNFRSSERDQMARELCIKGSYLPDGGRHMSDDEITTEVDKLRTEGYFIK